jgi:putative ABC transport system permease protein
MFEKLKLQVTVLIVALRTSGTRSLLAAIAVAMGSASLMTMLASSTGAQQHLRELTATVGKNLFMVKSGRSSLSTAGALRGARLTLADAAAIGGEIPEIRQVLPVLQKNGVLVRWGPGSFPATVLGITAPYFEARNWRLARGRLFDALDDSGQQKVAVVGAGVASSLGGEGSLVGATLLIAGVPFEVVGQLQEKGLGSDVKSEDMNIYVPLQSSMRRLFNAEDVTQLLVQVHDRNGLDTAPDAIAAVLRREHKLPESSEDDFEMLSLVQQNQASDASNALLRKISQFLAATLLVLGGVGIFTITYFNVMHRHPEIGLRRAIGATKRHIATMFATEACLLSAFGGILGCLVGAGVIFVLAQWTQWAVSVDLNVVIAPLVISLLIGVTFGVVPALRASRLSPVEALRAN